MTTDKHSDDAKALCRLLTDDRITSDTCIAAAIILDNRLTMIGNELENWINCVKRISELMIGSDEPRFTLYDYLDALINAADPWSWENFYEQLSNARNSANTAAETGLFNELISKAKHKREVYHP